MEPSQAEVHAVSWDAGGQGSEAPGSRRISVLGASSIVPTLFFSRTGPGPPFWTTFMMSFTPTHRPCWAWAQKRTSLRMGAMGDSWSLLRYRHTSGWGLYLVGVRVGQTREGVQGLCGPDPRAQVPGSQCWHMSGRVSKQSRQLGPWCLLHPFLSWIISSWPRGLRNRDRERVVSRQQERSQHKPGTLLPSTSSFCVGIRSPG